jgi:hypothetical protein
VVAGHINERSVFIRELLPQNIKIEIERLTVPDAMKATSFPGWCRRQGSCATDERKRPKSMVD